MSNQLSKSKPTSHVIIVKAIDSVRTFQVELNNKLKEIGDEKIMSIDYLVDSKGNDTALIRVKD